MAKIKSKGKKKVGPKNLGHRGKDGIKKKVLNPFEVHVNRQKHDVLGRKVKNDRGLPGVARAKAIKKRKSTLLQEYRVHDKSNKFLDRRIGEKNRAMTGEDRIMARFTAERMKVHNKKAMFNLADDEVLTHHGQTLNEIEKFDDPRSEDEDDGEQGKLDANFVKEAHFGGGIFSKSSDPQSRKDLIEQLIAESKKRKAEQKKSREQAQELTDKLDTEWKDLLPIIATSKKKPEQESMDVDKPDEYDVMMRELRYEARGKPTDRLKSEEEIAVVEKERLESLEADRLKRMHGITESKKPTITHRSADDLDDGFAIDSDDDGRIVSYDADGKLEKGYPTEDKKDDDMETDEEENEAQESGSEGSSEEEDGNEDDEDNLEDLKSDSENDETAEEKQILKKDSGERVNSEEPTSSGNEEVLVEKVKQIKGKSQLLKNVAAEKYKNDTQDGKKSPSKIAITDDAEIGVKNETIVKNGLIESNNELIKKDLLARKLIMETARKELPYTFKVPENFEDLQELLVNRSPEYQAVIVERVIKCSHPSLAAGNKDKLATLLAFLLQHLHDKASPENGVDCFVVLDRLAPHFYDLAIMAPGNARRCVAEVIKEKQHDFRSQRRTFPSQDTLVFLKLVSLLFPTSDYRHPVVTPAFVFMGQMLSKCHVKTRRDVASGLYIATLLLEFTVLSKRFCPAVIDFLLRLVQSAAPENKSRDHLLKVPTSFTASPNHGLLSLKELSSELKMDNSFRYQAVSQAVRLLEEFCANLSDLPAPFQIFQPIMLLKSNKLPTILRKQVESLQSSVKAMGFKHMPKLVPEAKQPKVLRLYEPSFDKVYDGKTFRVMGRERQEREKLLHKVKRETKGAMREIRRDKTFIAKLKIKQTMQNDSERKAKVREIYGSAATQQGELKALERKK